MEAEPRTEDVLAYKRLIKVKDEDKFDIGKSIWVEWADNLGLYRKCVTNDMIYWKIAKKVVTIKHEYDAVVDICIDNAKEIWILFMSCTSYSTSYPCMNQGDLLNFYKESKVIDDNRLKMVDINVAFAAATAVDKKLKSLTQSRENFGASQNELVRLHPDNCISRF